MTARLPAARILGAALIALIAAAWVVGGFMRLSVGSGVDSFLPSSDPSVESLDDLAGSFGGDPVVVLLESGQDGTLLDQEHLPALLQLEGELAKLPDVAVTYGPATTLNQTVIRIQNLIVELSGRRDGLRAAGRERDAERFDRRYGSLVVRGMPAGLPTLKNPQFVQQVIYQENGTVEPRWAQFVPDHGSVAIYLRPREGLDQEAASTLTDAVSRTVDSVDVGAERVTVTGAPVITAQLAEQARGELPKLGLAALAAVALALLLVPWTRRSRRLLPLIPMVLATLMTLAWFGWRGDSVSLGAVAFLPVILGLGSYYPVYLAQAGHRRRVLAVAGAAAAAFGSLMLSPLPFVRDLGQAIALGIILVVATSVLMGRLLGWTREPVEPVQPAERWVPGGSRRAGLTVLAGLAVLACAGWALLPRVQVQTDPQELISGLPAFDDVDHAEEVIGFSAEVDVVLTGPDVTTPEALQWLRQAHERLAVEHADKLRPIVSPVDLLGFLGPRPTKPEIDAALRLLPEYVSGSALTTDRSRAVISLGGRWRTLNDDPDLVSELQSTLPAPPTGYRIEVTGLPVAASRGYELVSDARYESNVVGIAVAGLVLLLLVRPRRDVPLAVASAAVATGLSMFTAWAAGIALNPLTLALGPLAAATACEFAVLLAAARRNGDRSLRRSVLLAATLSAAGYGVLTFSGLQIVQEFGIALVVSVGFALLSAAAVTWALATPLPSPPVRPTVPSGRELATVGDSS